MASLPAKLVQYRTLMYDICVTTMTASEARAALPAILDLVATGEEVTITRHGQAVAVVVRPDSLRSRRTDRALASTERLRAILAAGRETPLRAGALSEARAEELIAEVNTSRDHR
jgi:prevent-host-death family protein